VIVKVVVYVLLMMTSRTVNVLRNEEYDMKLKVYDKVKLLPKFGNDIVYVVATVRDTGIISLFPESGGFNVSADIKNLVKVG
jgi:hypothetical protein